MSIDTLTPSKVAENECPFGWFEDTKPKLYKVYNDGGHYIASLITPKHKAFHQTHRTQQDIDIAFDSIYYAALKDGLKGKALFEKVCADLLRFFPERENMGEYVEKKIEQKHKNLASRKKRFRRKANLNNWNYFVTLTYDDDKMGADAFRKKLRKCLCNLHTRRGWRYMGVFEQAPETGRLHFHGIFYIPNGEMIGKIHEHKDWSTAQHKMQTVFQNTFFAENYGRNDFKELNEMELKAGRTLEYLLKYIGKTGEKIVYSRGIPTEICCEIKDTDIVTEMQDFGTKYILFDDVIDWETDVAHFTWGKQMTLTDWLCNGQAA